MFYLHWRNLLTGARVAFGGNPLEGHTIPDVYGALQPTAVFVPLEQMLRAENYPIVTREVFGPFQVRYVHYHTTAEPCCPAACMTSGSVVC